MRTTNAVVRKQKKKAILERAAGFRGRKGNCVDLATGPVKRSMMAQSEGRHLKRRILKRDWIIRVNALLREQGLKYSTHIGALKQDIENKCGHRADLRDICYIMQHDASLMRNIVSKIAKSST